MAKGLMALPQLAKECSAWKGGTNWLAMLTYGQGPRAAASTRLGCLVTINLQSQVHHMRLLQVLLALLILAVHSPGYSQPDDYFPLQVDNYWKFVTFDLRGTDTLATAYRFTIRVVADTIIEGIKYYRIAQQWNGISIPDTVIARQDRLSHSIIWRLGGRDQAVYRFSEPVGASWTVDLPLRPEPDNMSWPHSISVTQDDLDGISLAIEAKAVVLRFFSSAYGGKRWEEAYAVGIGPVYIKQRYMSEAEAWDFAIIDEAYVGGRLIVVDSVPTRVEQASYGAIKLHATK